MMDEVLQLLECCDEELRRDVTRMAGGSLTNKTAEEALAACNKDIIRQGGKPYGSPCSTIRHAPRQG